MGMRVWVGRRSGHEGPCQPGARLKFGGLEAVDGALDSDGAVPGAWLDKGTHAGLQFQ
jgi:hypothetical protein